MLQTHPPPALEGVFRVPPAPWDAVVEILLVEDNAADADLMVEALKEGTLRSNVHVVDNGEDAVAYLRREGPYADAVSPDLILLDLHLPRLDGHGVLREVKEDDLLRRIPIVIFTASRDEEDIRAAYDLYANCCVSKPTDLEEYGSVVRRIEQFWLRVARRP
jgi:two-component system, chemotaxis family, response regulator Rcp1